LADTETLFRHFQDAEKECLHLLEHRIGREREYENWTPALPAYDQCLKASHIFNLLDARGVISVTERQAYIGRVRTIARACAQAWLASPQGRTDAAEKAAAHEERVSFRGAAK
ncbi:MAG: glycine--tRNA ligase subunit alpha, partial [Alphaproteobacteria bacterium]